MSEILRVELCVGQVRVLTCVLVSFCVTKETERGRESALRYPCLRAQWTPGKAVGEVEASTRERSLRPHSETVLARSRETLRVVLCVGQMRVLTCVPVSFCVTGETERGRESALRYPARP